MHIEAQAGIGKFTFVQCTDASGSFGAALTTAPMHIPTWVEKRSNENRLAALRNAGLSGLVFFHKKWTRIELTPVGEHKINGHVINRLPIQ